MTTTETSRPQTFPVVGVVTLIAGLALMTALSWRGAGDLPDPVIFAGGGRDGADSQMPRLFVLTAMPLVALLLGVLLLVAQRVRRATASAFRIPLWRDDRAHRRSADLVLGVVTPVLTAIHLAMLQVTEGLTWLAAAVALVAVAIGNVWPKQAPAVPDVVGARLGAAARERVDGVLEANRRRLRPTGVAMALLGLTALALAWPAPAVSLGVSLTAVLIMAVVPLATTLRAARADGALPGR